MHPWTDYFRYLPFLVLFTLLGVGAAIFLYDGLRFFLRSVRTSVGKSSRPPGLELHPGPFHLNKPPNAVQRLHARRHEVKLMNHWGCRGRWVPRD